MNKRKPSTLSGSSGDVSVDSFNMSENSFVNKVKGKWGDEESELRQAIYFQFIKTVSLIGTDE